MCDAMTAAERLDTDPSAPPSDSLAEAVVLYVCELWPEVIDRYWLRLLGNGVVPHTAEHAYRTLRGR